MSTLPTEQETPTITDQQVKVGVQRTYLKNQRCECPHAPLVFKAPWKPEITTELSIHHQRLEEDAFEVTLRLHVIAKNDGRTATTITIEQAGIFTIQEATPEQIGQVLNVYCAMMLYPYATRAVNTLATDASLGPIYLTPVNFDALYQQNKAKSEEEQGTTH